MHKPRTTIAVVRDIIGLTLKEMASLIGYSLPTIQSLAGGRLKPSFKVAERISLETGVSLKWLLNGPVSKKPMAEAFRGKFTRHTFEETQAAKSRLPDFSISHPWLAVALPLTFRIQRMCAIFAKANEHNQMRMCSYKVDSFFDDLEKEFGADKDIDGLPYYLAPQGQRAAIPEIIDVMPIIRAFHAQLQKQVARHAKRRRPDFQSGMPEKPVADEIRVSLTPMKSDFPELLDNSVFRRKDITENQHGLLPTYVNHPRLKPPTSGRKTRAVAPVTRRSTRSKRRVKKHPSRV